MEADPGQEEEVAVLRAAGAARSQTLAELFERHRKRLLRMIELRMDPMLKSRIDASDVIQEAYVEISDRVDEYLQNPRMPFFLWIRFITAQKLMRLYRFHVGTQKRSVRKQITRGRPEMPEATSIALVDHILGGGTSPTGAVVRDEQRMQLQGALDSLKPGDREVLVLRHFEMLSNAEAARELGISEDASSKRYIRALERIRNALKN